MKSFDNQLLITINMASLQHKRNNSFLCFSVWSARDYFVPKNLFVIRITQRIEHVIGASTVTIGVHTFTLPRTTLTQNVKNYRKLWLTSKIDTSQRQRLQLLHPNGKR